MEEKTKFIIMALIGILVISLLFNLQIYSSKQAVLLERDSLSKEKSMLAKKIEEVLKESKMLEDRTVQLRTDLERASKEKEELQSKFEIAAREKEEVVKKLKSMPLPSTVTPAVIEQKQAVSSFPSDAYWATVLKAKTNLELQLETLRSQLKIVQINNEQLQKDKTVIELEAKNIARQKDDLVRQYAYSQKRSQEMIDKLAQELVMEKNDKFQIEESVKSVKNENDILKRQFKTQGARKINLETQLADLQKEKADFENKLGVMDSVLKDNIAQIDNFKRQLEASQKTKISSLLKKDTVELAPIIIRPKQEAHAQPQGAPSSKGRVVSVNEENNFVIIDLGEDSGVRMGDVFQVYRQDKQIAVIEVIQLKPEISACDIKRQAAPIKPDDTIR